MRRRNPFLGHLCLRSELARQSRAGHRVSARVATERGRGGRGGKGEGEGIQPPATRALPGSCWRGGSKRSRPKQDTAAMTPHGLPPPAYRDDIALTATAATLPEKRWATEVALGPAIVARNFPAEAPFGQLPLRALETHQASLVERTASWLRACRAGEDGAFAPAVPPADASATALTLRRLSR
eukprot:2888965-Pyramimonas_sp.AAC.1